VTYDAVLLTSFGGPEGPDEVMPFLERVTAGRGVPRERLEQVAEHYLALGGVSPINDQNRLLLERLRAAMDARGVDLPLYWGNRNSAPFLADVVLEIRDAGHRQVLAVATSAYSSYSGCRQYRENLASALVDADLVGQLEIRKARPYYDRPGFVAPFVDGTREAMQSLPSGARTRVLFTTHSIPLSMAQTSGPTSMREAERGLYERQHLEVARNVMSGVELSIGVPAPDWRLVFQSRSGPPAVPWLEPDVNDAIAEAHAEGVDAVVLVPIGFISDHVEVVWDLDHEARQTAEQVGVGFARVATPGVDPRFVESLVDVIADAQEDGEPASPLCSGECCPNARADRPVVPAG
jgi:protoporphyrin/coproporphyrin ferrochelatase